MKVAIPFRRLVRWHGSRLALQLTGILLLISVLPLITYYVAAYTTTENAILDIASRQSLQNLRGQKDYLVLQLDQIEALAANISQVDEINAYLAQSNAAGRTSTYDSLATKARIGYLLSNYRNLNGLVSIDIFTLSGAHYHVGDTLTENSERSSLRESMWDRSMRSRTFAAWQGVEDNIERYSSSQKVLTFSKILVSSTSSWLKAEPVAMLVVNYSTSYLHDHFIHVDLGRGGYMMVLDDQHRLIYHPDVGKIGTPVTRDFSNLLVGDSGSFIQRLGTADVLLTYERIPDKNWFIVSVLPRQTLLASLANAHRVAAALLLAMMALVALLLKLFSVRVLGPITDIAEAFRKFQTNKIVTGWRMARPISLEPIADLALWFNLFLESMETRRESEVQLRIAATAFESQEGMFVSDANGVILRVNSALTALTGYAAGELIGRTSDIFCSDRNGPGFQADMLRSIELSGSWRGEIWNRRKDGTPYPAWQAVTAVRNEHNVVTHFVASLTDITDRKASEEEIRQLAFYDSLTGLPNRRLLIDRLRQAMLETSRRRQSVALMFLDLDKFKTLNDTFGHDVGDSLLKQVAQRLVHCVREVDTVARLGGDEFVILVEGLDMSVNEAAQQAEIVAVKVLRALAAPYDSLGGLPYHSTSSIGITLFSDSNVSLEDLMKQADIALYQAKDAGRNTLRFFDPQMQAQVLARVALEQSVRQGLINGEFIVHFQPKVGLDKRTVGVEGLIRWAHPRDGIVLPQAFIALAEETGLIVSLGRVVLAAACEQLVAWADRPERGQLRIAVNVSVREFRQPDFVASVLAIVDASGADARRLTLEITESVFAEHMSEIVEKMTVLRERGIDFALDDFGTGYSSLTYLKRMPLKELKIDGSFVRDVLTDPNDATIARAIIALGHELGIEVVAEGVESQAQFEFLAASGCRTFQGNLFSAPMAADALERFLDAPESRSVAEPASRWPAH